MTWKSKALVVEQALAVAVFAVVVLAELHNPTPSSS